MIHDKVKRTSVEVAAISMSIVPEGRDANDTKKTTGRGEVWRGTQCIQYKVIEFEVDDRRTKKSMSAENTKGAISTLRSLPLKYEIIVANDLE